MLFDMNPQCLSRLKVERNKIIFECKDEEFSGSTIAKIIGFVNKVHRQYKNLKVPLIFSFGDVRLADKLSYVILECICYFLMSEYHHKVYLYWNPKLNILTDGVFYSPLKLLNGTSDENMKKFIQKFEMDIYQRHFRRLVNGNDKENTNYLGKLLQDLDTFLTFFSIAEDYKDQISEVIIELIGNACEHGHTNCLLDIDITGNHQMSIANVPQEGDFYGINIAIIDFSNILLGDGIRDKIDNNILKESRYLDLADAYNYHKAFFTEEYSYTDFCNISSLQDKISGRPCYSLSGGTGLTKLVHSLQDKSEVDSCYVISGRRCVRFIKNLLNYDDKYWLGFNEERDFFHNLPRKDVTVDCYIFFPGTAYNLNFVMKREDG
jgi:hypothetical protein